jgi:hypothetical protein
MSRPLLFLGGRDSLIFAPLSLVVPAQAGIHLDLRFRSGSSFRRKPETILIFAPLWLVIPAQAGIHLDLRFALTRHSGASRNPS